jgi:hypothetical protein
MIDDTEVSARADTADICGEVTSVVRVSLVDAHGHPHDFTLDVDDADDLADQLRRAVAA